MYQIAVTPTRKKEIIMKKFSTLFLPVLIMLTVFSCEVSEDAGDDDSKEKTLSTLGYYEIEDYDPLTGFTEDQLKSHYSENYASTENATTAVTGANIETETKGSLTDSAIEDFVRRTNFFRSLHQLPPVSLPDDATNAKCQDAALSMAIENTISHTPKDDVFEYVTDDADEAAQNSNLAISWSSDSYDYTNLLDNLVMDVGVDSTGHRKWFLLPGQKGAGYGYIYNSNEPTYGKSDVLVQWVFDYYDDVTADYDHPVLYPAAGAFPIEFTIDSFDRMVDFSLYWVGASFTGCTVSIKSDSGSTIGNTITVNEAYNKYSMPPAALVFQPASQPSAGDSWTITITGITGKDKSELEYTINFIQLDSTRSLNSESLRTDIKTLQTNR
jgi:uncharacterized protein YkwD